MINDKNNELNQTNDSTVFSTPEVKQKDSKLSSKKRGLIFAGVCVVIAVVVAVTAIFVIPADNGEATSSESVSAQSISILSFDEKQVESYDVKNDKGSYNFYQTETLQSTSSGSTDTTEIIVWTVKGKEKYVYPSLTFFSQTLANLTATKKYDDVTDLEPYGFDNPFSVINVSLKDGSKKTVTVGKLSPDNSGHYVTVDNDSSVYLVTDSSFISYMSRAYSEFLSNSVIISDSVDVDEVYYDSSGNILGIDYLVLDGRCRKERIKIVTPQDIAGLNFIATEPGYRSCDYDKIHEMLTFAVSGLQSSGVYKVGYKDADLEKYGLKNPYSSFECKIDDYSFSVKFGDMDEYGYYPCIVEDGYDIIYKINSVNYPFITNDGEDVYVESVFIEYVANIDSFTVTTADDKNQFVLDRSENTESDEKTVFRVFANDKLEIERKQFSYMYERLILFTAEEYLSDTPSGDPYYTIDITYNNGKSPDRIELYKMSDRRYLFLLNGNGNSLIASSNVEDLLDSMYKLLAEIEIDRP